MSHNLFVECSKFCVRSEYVAIATISRKYRKRGAFQDGSRGTLLKVTERSYDMASHSFPDQHAGAAVSSPIQESSPGIYFELLNIFVCITVFYNPLYSDNVESSFQLLLHRKDERTRRFENERIEIRKNEMKIREWRKERMTG